MCKSRARLPVQSWSEREDWGSSFKNDLSPSLSRRLFQLFPEYLCKLPLLQFIISGGCVRKWVRDVYYLPETTHSHRTKSKSSVSASACALFALSSVNHLNPLRNKCSDWLRLSLWKPAPLWRSDYCARSLPSRATITYTTKVRALSHDFRVNKYTPEYMCAFNYSM